MSNQELIQLPNKDLWRGHKVVEKQPVAAVVTTAELSLLDRAMQAIDSAAKGGTLSCLWCGQQFGSAEMRNHLKLYHKSVVEPVDVAALALATNVTTTAAAVDTTATVTETTE